MAAKLEFHTEVVMVNGIVHINKEIHKIAKDEGTKDVIIKEGRLLVESKFSGLGEAIKLEEKSTFSRWYSANLGLVMENLIQQVEHLTGKKILDVIRFYYENDAFIEIQ